MMKRLYFLIFISIFIFSSLLYSIEEGGGGFSLSAISPFAKAEGMGGAFGAMRGVSDSVFFNPAGLCGFYYPEFSFSYQNWIADMENFQAGVVYPKENLGIFSLLINYWGLFDELPAYDESGEKTGENFSVNNLFMIISYAKMVPDTQFSLGVNLKYLEADLFVKKYNSVALDLGALYDYNKNINLAVAYQNLGTTIAGSSLYQNLKLSASYVYFFNLKNIESLTGNIDLNYSPYSKISYPLGMELNFNRGLYHFTPCLRVGYNNLSELGGLSNLSFGMGLVKDNIIIDYSLTPYPLLKQYVNKITFKYQVPVLKHVKKEPDIIKEEKEEERLENIQEEIDKLYEEEMNRDEIDQETSAEETNKIEREMKIDEVEEMDTEETNRIQEDKKKEGPVDIMEEEEF